MKNDKFQENLSRPGIIDARARYRTAARRLRNNGVKYRLFLSDQTSFVMDRPVWTELFHVDGRTDRHDEANNRFLQFCERFYKACLLPSNCRLCLKRDDTRAETRFRLSAKRTSPFKSAGGRQFSRLLAAEVCASAVVMMDTPCSEVVWRVLVTHSIASFPFTSPPVRHRVPSCFNWTLLTAICMSLE